MVLQTHKKTNTNTFQLPYFPFIPVPIRQLDTSIVSRWLTDVLIKVGTVLNVANVTQTGDTGEFVGECSAAVG